MKKLLVIVFILVCGKLSAQTFAGAYTIGGSGADYPTLTAAVNALKSGVVVQPVTFNLRTGVYQERVIIPLINGVSATNTVTFTSETGKAEDVTITGSGVSGADNHIIRLSNAEHIIIRDVTLINTGKYYACGVFITNASAFCKVMNCVIRMDSVTTFNEDNAGVNGASIGDPIFAKLNAQAIEVIGNKIYGGSYGVRFFGASLTVNDLDNLISDNEIRDAQVYAIHLRYNHAFTINNNHILSTPNGKKPQAGIEVLNGTYREVSGNRISDCRIYGIYYQNIEGVETALMANNMIGGGFETRTGQSGPMANAAVFMRNCNNINFVHNSIHYDPVHPSGSALYIDDGPGSPDGSRQITVQNNIIACTGGTIAYNVQTPDLILVSDYNDLYTTGPVLAYWNMQHPDLGSLKTESGLDENSLSVEPRFFKKNDLHTAHPVLDNMGSFYQLVTQDFDEEDRNITTPDIGADEYTVHPLDIAVSAIYPEVVPVNAEFSITAQFRNDGLNSLKTNTVNVAYSLDGGLTWSPSEVFTITGLETNYSTELFTFSKKGKVTQLKPYTFCVRIDNPGIAADPNKINDQYCADICVGLNGVYTIGGAAPDFLSIQDAVNAIKPCGIGGPVTFRIRPGIYEERFTLGPVINNTSDNPIVFESESGNASDVLITSAGGGSISDHHTIMLKQVNHVQLRDLTIQNTDDVLASGVFLAEGSSFNTIEDCILLGDTTTGSDNAVPILVNSKINMLSSENIFRNNIIKGGYYGIKLQGAGATVRDQKNSLHDNLLTGQRKTGIYTLYSDVAVIRNNRIVPENPDDSTTVGISVQWAKSNADISYNHIENAGTGIELNQDSALTEMLIGNNTIIAYQTGIYSLNTYNPAFIYNSVRCASDADGTALLLDGGNVNRVLNNIFANDGQGYAFYTNEDATYVAQSDHNCWYAKGPNLAFYTSDLPDLESLQTASNMEQNSVSTDPMFLSATDLHVFNDQLDGKAVPVPELTEDIDGDLRDSSAPDIGADEFNLATNGKAMLFKSPEPSSYSGGIPVPVTIRIKNTGAQTLNNIDLRVEVNGDLHDTGTFSGLAPNQETDYTFSKSYTGTSEGTFLFKAWLTVAGDTNPADDTVSTSIEVYIDGVEGSGTSPVRVFPNPFADAFFISSGNLIDQVSLINELGQERIIPAQKNRLKVDASDLSPGIYTLRIQEKSRIQVVRLIKYE